MVTLLQSLGLVEREAAEPFVAEALLNSRGEHVGMVRVAAGLGPLGRAIVSTDRR